MTADEATTADGRHAAKTERAEPVAATYAADRRARIAARRAREAPRRWKHRA